MHTTQNIWDQIFQMLLRNTGTKHQTKFLFPVLENLFACNAFVCSSKHISKVFAESSSLISTLPFQRSVGSILWNLLATLVDDTITYSRSSAANDGKKTDVFTYMLEVRTFPMPVVLLTSSQVANNMTLVEIRKPVLLLLFLCKLSVAYNPTNTFITDDCGVLDEIPGDARTQAPWTAAIFYRNSISENYTYQAAGIIIGPNTVLTVFAGVHGKLPRKVRGKYSIQNPSNTLVAAGIEDGNLVNADRHAQFTQVTFVEPYMGIEDQDKEYHFALLHLKTPFDFSSPYVRQLCIEEVGHQNAKLTQTLNSTADVILQGGFAKYKLKLENNQTRWGTRLKIQRVEIKAGYDCVQSFEHYYNSDFPVGMFCAQLPEGSTVGLEQDLSCLLHGSAIVRKSKGNQWKLVGLTALIRGRKGGLCRNDTVYFNARLSYTLEWIRRSLRCSPFSFSCGDGGCTSLEAVCNSVPNCLDESDEEERFCHANNRCDGNTPHQCNLLGETCISREALCNGHFDCDDGSDEVMCQGQAGRRARDAGLTESRVCPALPRKEGVYIEYVLSDRSFKVTTNISSVPVNTFAYLKCKNFYKSKYIYNHIENQCVDEGAWSTFSPFECEADCGMPNRIVKSDIPDSDSKLDAADLSFPWNALLYIRNESAVSTIHKVLCAATLIGKSTVVTSANCLLRSTNESITAENLVVVLNPSSELFSENLLDPTSVVVNAASISFNANAPSKSSLAIVTFYGELEFSPKIRPICLRHNNWKEDAESKHKRFNSRLRSRMSIALKGMHVAEFPAVVEVACIRRDFNYASDMKCISHYRGVSIPMKYTGGALVTQERTKFGSRFVLKGVLKNKDDTIAYFTAVDPYMDWITVNLE